ncbi:MAG TPA: hypothetical protein PKV16_08425 [Caldisericia bacterium]|nr:hypothetical protein [Caldisericia bacterium]HPF49373.1 hypothetical protein [Caldisericia bacterium]HPI84449.1 hypothetical protein [Caldisericia bacterium]HPQ93790.1 hypothetical protein [Caldisericia bacterium]HRV75646.1 hypothetical protein [Caldisericia bacterium]
MKKLLAVAVLICSAVTMFSTAVFSAETPTGGGSGGIRIRYSPAFPEDTVIRTWLEEHIHEQIQIFEDVFGPPKPDNFEIIVYPDFDSLSGYAHDMLRGSNTVVLVTNDDYLQATGKTRPIFRSLIRLERPMCNEGTMQIIETFLALRYFDIPIVNYATQMRAVFQYIPVPEDPDRFDFDNPMHISTVVRACASLEQYERDFGKSKLRDFMFEATKSKKGFKRALEAEYGVDFRTFIRQFRHMKYLDDGSSRVLLPSYNSDEGRTEFARIEDIRGHIWSNMPMNPIPLDYKIRMEPELLLEQAAAYVNREHYQLADETLDKLDGYFQVKHTHMLVWWAVAFVCLLLLSMLLYFSIRLMSPVKADRAFIAGARGAISRGSNASSDDLDDQSKKRFRGKRVKTYNKRPGRKTKKD